MIRRDQLGDAGDFLEGIMGDLIALEGHGDAVDAIADELRGVRGQISDLDRKVDKYVDQCLRELGQDHIRLDF